MVGSSARLRLIITLIDLAQADVSSCNDATYHSDRLLTDATAHRVMHIGENVIRLDAAIRSRHPNLPWRDMAATRNVVAHDYDGINHGLIRRAVVEDLDEVRTMCLAELELTENQGE